MKFETILYEKQGHVATITLNRPEKLNSFNQEMQDELMQVWRDVKFDDDIRVVVMTGAGDRAFCSGVDVGRARDGGEPEHRIATRLSAKQNECYKPVIVAVNGLAAGGGAYWLGSCEFAIAAEHATFFDPHVDRGLIPAEEPLLYMHMIPWQWVMRIALLGTKDRLDAQTAKAIGLVTEVVPKEELMPTAYRYAEIIAQHSPDAVQHAVELLWKCKGLPLAQALDAGWMAIGAHSSSPDIEEGIQAFLEKRPPQWGRAAS